MQEVIGETRAGGDEMLAVIKNEQEFFIAQIIGDKIRACDREPVATSCGRCAPVA